LKSIKTLDIIHLHSSKAGFLGRIAAYFLGLEKKTIYTPHGVSFLRKDISPLQKKIFIYLEKLAFKLGGTVVACSKSEADELKKYGIEAHYIYNGIKCYEKEKKNINYKKKIIIGTIGRITPPKNPWLFNKIAQQYINYKKVKFVWIGDGELKNVLTSPNIEITGWLDRNEVFKKLDNIDIYLSTSLWEGLPLSVLQAMCKRKPLVLTDCVGNRDTVIENFNGFLFKKEEEAVSILNNLINNPQLIHYLGENSFLLFKERFTLEKMITSYDALYKKIIYKGGANL